MSRKSSKTLRKTLLAAATATMLSPFIAGTAFAQAKINTVGIDNPAAYNGFIVRYKDGTVQKRNPATVQRSLDTTESMLPNTMARSAGNLGNPVTLKHSRRLSIGADLIRPNRKLNGLEAETLMRALAADPNVEYVEPDYIMVKSWTPNDPHYRLQYGYGSGAGGIRADQAWDTARGNGIVVAVLDTGISAHSDLDANVLPGYDFISSATAARDGNGRDSNPRDEGDWVTANQCGGVHEAQNSSWHGTHVAGTVAAVSNNGRGVAGTAPSARILPVRVLGACGGATSDIVDAITWASGGSVSGVPANANPAEVINMSLGSTVPAACSTSYQNAINAATRRGTIVVTAAGNDNTTANHMPGNCANVINVGATDASGGRASRFSNYGRRVHISAPGDRIASTVNTGTTRAANEGYTYMSGTSMAAPHVAGVVALVQSAVNTPLTPARMLQLLQSTARPLQVSCPEGCGAGIINAKAAVDAATGGGGSGSDGGGNTPGPSPDANVLQNGTPVSGISGTSRSERKWTVQVPANRSRLRITLSGGRGDADLYVRFGSAPTATRYHCRPYRRGNNEACIFNAPSAGTWHVMVRGDSAFSGASLTATY
ncbi:peptidase S8 [Lysobacter pythonis]|uniref:Peptidase S8 n=1 Tax=Solilutibacter pythonis TaxID=2483112 RepID=A0A3M2HYF4_9GAMM|nr:S8 family peptidase [Lysobacter pythonis]RMH90864.1 peptidase S8 [Lysobacter pythonis]